VQQIRQRWPQVQIILRARFRVLPEKLMQWCEQNRVIMYWLCPQSETAHLD